MNRNLTLVHDRLIAGISAMVGADGFLTDPCSGALSPTDHYAQCSAALALALARPARWDEALLPLRAWSGLERGRIGHLPFNRLMLGRLKELATQREGAPAVAQLIGTAFARCELAQSYPSNNWTLLAQACRVIEAAPAAVAAESRSLCTLLHGWTTAAGAFIDYPRSPNRRGRFATPIAYHHKALFLAALVARHRPDPQLLEFVRRLLDWLVHCWDPSGYAGGLGRSNHALFGDACLLAALIMLGHDTDDVSGPVEALAQRLARQQRADGLLWLDPAGAESGCAAWDAYMHLSVYNAWAGALIGLARHLGPIAADQRAVAGIEWRAAREGLFHDDQAGLVGVRHKGMCLILTTRGQLPQSFSRNEAEFRYAGGTPLHWNLPEKGLRVAPPLRIAVTKLRAQPCLAGWTPVFEQAGSLYALTDFDEPEIEETADDVSLCLVGQPVALTRADPKGLVRRLVAFIDWRLMGGRLSRRASLQRACLKGVSAKLRLAISTIDARIEVEFRIRLAAGQRRITYLNPNSHRVVGACAKQSDYVEATAHSSIPGALARSHPPLVLADGETTFRFILLDDMSGWQTQIPR